MSIAVEDLEPYEDGLNPPGTMWKRVDEYTDIMTEVYVSRPGQTVESLVEELNAAVIMPAPENPPVSISISDRQFFQQLAIMELITQQEALTYLGTGVLPAAFEAFVQALPEAAQFDARMKLMANTFNRSDELVNVFGSMQGFTSEQIDALWTAASQL